MECGKREPSAACIPACGHWLSSWLVCSQAVRCPAEAGSARERAWAALLRGSKHSCSGSAVQKWSRSQCMLLQAVVGAAAGGRQVGGRQRWHVGLARRKGGMAALKHRAMSSHSLGMGQHFSARATRRGDASGVSLQVGVGAAAGWLAAKWVCANAEGAPGWHARKGGPAARAMALTAAAAAGVPAAAGALLARQPPAVTGAAHRGVRFMPLSRTYSH